MERIFCKNIVQHVCNFIEQRKDIIYFLSTCKYFHGLKNEINYGTFVNVQKIAHLPYRDRFINIIITHIIDADKLSKNVKNLVLLNYRGDLDLSKYTSITYLVIGFGCKLRMKNLELPPNLYYLTLHMKYMQKFPWAKMPTTLKELVITDYKHKSLVIPKSVTSLVIGDNCVIKDIIFQSPVGLRHLEIDYCKFGHLKNICPNAKIILF